MTPQEKRDRRTRIVATIGPSSDAPDSFAALLAAGVDVVRLNASHATPEFYARVIPMIRETAEAQGRNVGILLDLRGPKIRVGAIEGGSVRLDEGANVAIVRDDGSAGTAERIPCSYAALIDDVEVGDVILLDDGLIELVATEKQGDALRCRVVTGGVLKSNKGINVPGRALSTPAFGDKDRRDLEAALPLGVDFVALSFVRSAQDVERLKEALREFDADLPVIAKIEKPQALDALDEILAASDGVMVARGDLGVEIPPERVPRVQKRIIARANALGLPVITATQMLESMIHNPRPTRAEASDVANAIFDGTDAVMLSAESAAGKYPVEAVAMMDRIAREAEASEFYGKTGVAPGHIESFAPELRSVGEAAARIARELDADCIAVYTLSGTTARMMSKLRPRRPIYALCPDLNVCRRMALEHGIVAVNVDYYANTDDLLREGDRLLQETGLIEKGACVIAVGGTRQFTGVTNMIQVRHLGAGEVE